jgi:hypothetical protein
MPNRFQIKRTTTTGLLPNVSNSSNTSYIAAGELAINLTDRKLLSSNGSATFEVGANLATIVVGTAFTQTSGNANFDSGALFVDGTNNRVGVGTTSPTHVLHANGSSAPILAENSGGGTYMIDMKANTGTYNVRLGNAGDTFLVNVNNAERMRITGSGNVGIGNTNPAHVLSVTGTTNLDGAVTGITTLAAGNTTVTGFANVSGIVSADYYTAANNGNGTNYKVGDDAWIGDVDTADTVGIKGQQNTSLGFIKFGTAPSTFGYNGTALTYTSNVSLSNTKINDILTIANDKGIIFNNPTAGNGVKLVHQSDDNFVFYVASTTGTERPIFSVFSNSNTSSFAVQTAITATGDITAFFSDDRLKDRYSNIPNAVEKVKSLNGFYYEPNITAQDLGYQKEMHVGISAQEVNAIMPEVVAPAPIDNKYLTVKYDRLIPLLIEAIKEQQIQIDELKAQLNKD